MSTTYKDNQRGRSARLWLAAVMALLMLAGCGGGGGGTGGGFTAPDPIRVTASAAVTSVPANPLELDPAVDSPFTTQVNVRVVNANGTPVQDGTVVNFTTNNTAVGSVSTLDDPDTDDVNEFTGRFGQIGTTTSGGNAIFFFTSGTQTGTAVLTASAPDPFSNANISATLQVSVTPNTSDSRLTLTATRSTLPANVTGVPPFIGSPYLSEVTIRFRGTSGDFVSPAGGEFGVAIAPVTVGAFSTLDDPSTDDVNEFFNLLGNGPVSSAGGQGTVFIHSADQPGTVTLTVTASDPVTNESFSQQVQVTIVAEAADGLPATVGVTQSPQPVYTLASGGNTSKTVNVEVLDAGGQSVSDPIAGSNRFNNVRLILDAPSANGSRISGTNASGSNVSGDQIDIATTNSVVQAGFTTGNEVGVHRVVAMADRADNNVDNGIQDAITSNVDIVVGDGRLAGLEIAAPTVNAIRINRVINDVDIDPDEVIPIDDETGIAIPPDPDATYRLTLSVTTTDGTGNPALPGTMIQAGTVDSPLDAIDGSVFAFSGVDGNPVEGGILFTTPTTGDGFLDGPGVDEAVNIGDFVLTLGDLVPGNRELESVRVTSNIPTDNILNVTQPFNNNDGSGVVVDDGPVIPYVIGRSTVGNVSSGVLTPEEDGVAEYFLTYPITAVGQPLALWVQGNREDNGSTQTVADVELIVFPGIAPATLFIIPNAIRGNTTEEITICVTDALGVALRNVPLSFTTQGQGSFSVSDDPLVTGPNGCVTTDATSSGLALDQEPLRVTFSGAGASGLLVVTPPDTAFISASPSALLLTSSSPRTVTVTVVDENDAPIPNVTVMAMCEAPVTVTPAMGSTDVDGQAQFTLTTTEEPMTDPVVGSCTFSVNAGGGTISTTVIYTIPVTPPSP